MSEPEAEPTDWPRRQKPLNTITKEAPKGLMGSYLGKASNGTPTAKRAGGKRKALIHKDGVHPQPEELARVKRRKASGHKSVPDEKTVEAFGFPQSPASEKRVASDTIVTSVEDPVKSQTSPKKTSLSNKSASRGKDTPKRSQRDTTRADSSAPGDEAMPQQPAKDITPNSAPGKMEAEGPSAQKGKATPKKDKAMSPKGKATPHQKPVPNSSAKQAPDTLNIALRTRRQQAVEESEVGNPSPIKPSKRSPDKPSYASAEKASKGKKSTALAGGTLTEPSKTPAQKRKTAQKRKGGPKSDPDAPVPVYASSNGEELRGEYFYATHSIRTVVNDEESVVGPKGFMLLADRRGPWEEHVFVSGEEGYDDVLLAEWLKGKCQICQKPTDEKNMVLCDNDHCQGGYHIYCLQPALKKLPSAEEDWLCPECK